jgi:hypothetical protein
MIAGVVDTALGWRATFVAAGIGPLLSIGTCALLPRPLIENKSARSRPPYRTLFRNRALIAYVAAFAGNTWEVFAVRVWFVAYLSWLLRLPGNHITLPALGLVSGAASLAGVRVSMVMAEVAARHGRRRVVIGIMLRFDCDLPRPIGNGGWPNLDRAATARAGPDHELRRCRRACRRRCGGGRSSPARGITRTLCAVGLHHRLSRAGRGWNGTRLVRRHGQCLRVDGRFYADRAWLHSCSVGGMVGARLGGESKPAAHSHS